MPIAGPLVSIVIPSYKPQFFHACLQSVVSQDYSELEVIVSDDCPTDEIAEICREYPFLRYSRNPSPGHYSNFDRCISLASGRYVKFLFDDDLMQRSCVRLMVEEFQNFNTGGPCMVASAYEQIDERGHVLNRQGFHLRSLREIMPDGSGIKALMVHATNYIGSLSSAMLSSDFIHSLGAGYFSRRMTTAARGLSDVALYFDLWRYGPIIYINEALVQFRMSRFNLTHISVNSNAILTLTAWECLIGEAFKCGLISRGELAHGLGQVADRYERWEGTFPELRTRRVSLRAQLKKG